MGKFIVIEGLDGAGTTTQASMLTRKMEAEGLRCVLTREPIGPIEDVIRKCLVNGNVQSLPWYFAAARAWHLEHIVEPSLKDGLVVVSDRYFHSSLAYQGITHSPELVWDLNKHFRRPDLTVYLDVPVHECVRRMEDRKSTDIFEREEFLRQVIEGYRHAFDVARQCGDLIVRLNGTSPVEYLAAQIWQHALTLQDR